MRSRVHPIIVRFPEAFRCNGNRGFPLVDVLGWARLFTATPAVNSSLKWVLQVKDVGHLRNLWWNFLEGTIPFDKMAFVLHVC